MLAKVRTVSLYGLESRIVTVETDPKDGSFDLKLLRPGPYTVTAVLPEEYVFAADTMLVPALALAEEGETPADITGLWYTEVEGMVVELTLNADGTYAVTIPARPDAGVSGAWEERDGFLHFDGNELPQVKVLGTDVMKWLDYDAFLRREAPLIYAPA